MSTVENILQLIQHYAAYEQSNPKGDIAGFYRWVNQQATESNMAVIMQIGSADRHVNTQVEQSETSIGILLGMLNKYARNYTKTALSNLPVSTPDEFGYLAKLSTHTHMTKTELATSGMDGKTTGLEIINRLLLHKLISERDNPEDKRSKLLALTAKGNKVLAECYVYMGKVAKILVGDLTEKERQILKETLLKLEVYHKRNEKVIMKSLANV